ncbi:hypothetical protein JX265_012437 [Neoarthrinium moseri]|uniref:Uncharacterized protein n=1 Tax=Neoarthrinium moseri TaxID=1658444 RepID=A0A9P9WAE6_9PEZI|nr:hypothetical protein JX265_012437 [Neoarthrinium moseri]
MFFKSTALLTAIGLASVSHALPSGVDADSREPNSSIAHASKNQDNLAIQYCGEKGAPAIHTTGDPETGPGFWITNNDGMTGNYFLYENSRDEHPWKYLTLDNGARRFVQVCPTWQGRVVRGTPAVNQDGKAHNLGTWAKSSVDSNGVMWGDVSFLEGSDGAAGVRTADGSNRLHGCTADLFAGAPAAALVAKGSGAQVLDKIVGDAPNAAARAWMMSKCSADEIYMEDNPPNPVLASYNGRMEFTFTKGRF